MQPVNSIVPTSASHSISDIIDSHCRQQQVLNEPVSHTASDNSYQPQHRDSCISDSRQQVAVASDHDRPTREPRHQPVVIFTDENDRNCLNVLHVTKPQHYQSAVWHETDCVDASSEVDSRQLRERGKLAERSAEFDKKQGRATQAVRGDGGTWSRPADNQRGHVLVQQVNALPHTDSLTASSEMAMQHRYTVQHSSLSPAFPGFLLTCSIIVKCY